MEVGYGHGQGEHAHLDMGERGRQVGSGGMKTGAGGKPQPYGWHGYYGGAGGGSSPGPVYRGKVSSHAVRGKVTPPVQGGKVPPPPPPASAPQRSPLGQGPERGQEIGKHYVLPSRVVEENKRVALVYSQEKGDLVDMEDRLVGHGYSGAPGYQDKGEHEGLKGKGVIPEGTWTIGPVIWNKDETRGKGENLIKLVPDDATAERVRAMGRDPHSFYIHAGKKDPNDRSASQGCIIIPEKAERKAIRQLQGAKMRVVR